MNKQNADSESPLVSLRTFQQTLAYKAVYGSTRPDCLPVIGVSTESAIARVQDELSYLYMIQAAFLSGSNIGQSSTDRHLNTCNLQGTKEPHCTSLTHKKGLLKGLLLLKTYCQQSAWADTKRPSVFLVRNYQQDRPRDWQNLVRLLHGSMETVQDLQEAKLYVNLCHWLHL